MGIGFMVIVPVLFWLFIVMLIIAISKPKHRSTQMGRGSSATQRYPGNISDRVAPHPSGKTNFDRPKMREGLFEMKLGKSEEKKKSTSFFSNTDFDDYSVLSRKKDYVTGYDKKYAKGGVWARQSKAKQYSHTYDGHEPWDKCIPKEKDPWDKDFYV